MNKLLFKFCATFVGILLICAANAYTRIVDCRTEYLPLSQHKIQFVDKTIPYLNILTGPPDGAWITVEVGLLNDMDSGSMKFSLRSNEYTSGGGASQKTFDGDIGKGTHKFTFYEPTPTYGQSASFHYIFYKLGKEMSNNNAITIMTCKYSKIGSP